MLLTRGHARSIEASASRKTRPAAAATPGRDTAKNADNQLFSSSVLPKQHCPRLTTRSRSRQREANELDYTSLMGI